MSTEPLTNLEVEVPDRHERKSLRGMAPVASALGVQLSMLRDGSIGETLELVAAVRGNAFVRHALFGDVAG